MTDYFKSSSRTFINALILIFVPFKDFLIAMALAALYWHQGNKAKKRNQH